MIRIEHGIGAFVGSAVGDALGAPFEFKEPGLYRRTYPVPVLTGTGEMQGGADFQWAAAEFTDDTQMAIALAESLLASDGFDPTDVWHRWRTRSHVSPGRSPGHGGACARSRVGG